MDKLKVCYELDYTGRPRHCCGHALIRDGTHYCTLCNSYTVDDDVPVYCSYMHPPKDLTFFDWQNLPFDEVL